MSTNNPPTYNMECIDNEILLRGEIFVPTNASTNLHTKDISIYIDLINVFANYTSQAASRLDDFFIPLLYETYVPQNYIECSFISDILEDIHLEKNFWFNVHPYLWHWILIEKILKLAQFTRESLTNNIYLIVPTNRYAGIDLNEMRSWVARRLGGKFLPNLLFIDDTTRLKILAQASKYNVLIDTSKKRACDWCSYGGIAMWYPEISERCTSYAASHAIFNRLEALGATIQREHQLDFPVVSSNI